ncbi:hypothetical protein AB0F88_11320 [Streptosporangium sp. NPDC023963]|uniref:hypothetical protein n=1 Tax=Streptosporangium sp. NPDC023963 TaxID=3155608 RepID=UPI00343D6611
MSAGAALVLGASTAASAAPPTAVTGLPAPAVGQVPYPPGPNEEVNSIKQENDNATNIDLKDRKNHRGGSSDDCEGDCCGDDSSASGDGCRPDSVADLPFTGAPLTTVAMLGGGLLAAGTVGTLIAVRRRRSASAE